MNHFLLEKLTIVIYTYNRHKFLKRTINYWLKFNVKILILDGSDCKFDELNLENKNIKYVHDQRGFYKRLIDSSNYINTEFMMLGCDDEFYLPSALNSCIKFLTKNPEYSTCGGCAIGFGVDHKKRITGSQIYSKLINASLNQDSVYERIQNHFSNYVQAHTYSILRTSKYKVICRYVFEKEYNFFAASEYQMEFLSVVAGKTKIIPELLWMRNTHEVPPIRGTSPTFDDTIKLGRWWNDARFKEEKFFLLHRMEIACNELFIGKELKLNQNLISELFEIFIDGQSSKDRFSLNAYLKKIGSLLPYKIKNLIKIIICWNKIILIKNKNKAINCKSLEEEIKVLEEEGVLVNHKEINQVISSIQHT
jgi:glycosyltransferase domain-containing protein